MLTTRKLANCSNLIIVIYRLGNFGRALCIRSCHEDLLLTRKSHNCAGIAFIQGDSAGGSKLIEQTLPNFKFKYEDSENIKSDLVSTVVFNLHQIKRTAFFGTPGSLFLFL